MACAKAKNPGPVPCQFDAKIRERNGDIIGLQNLAW
jgi:hypothetical protein